MSIPVLASPRSRDFVAVVALIVAAVLTAVAASQLFLGAGTDPRDTLGSRAAGFGFTDNARRTLFAAIPLALPLAAALLSRRRGIRLLAVVEYATMIAIGLVIAVTAFDFAMATAAEQQRGDLAATWIDERSAMESLAADLAIVVLTAVAAMISVRAWRQARAPVDRLRRCTTVRY